MSLIERIGKIKQGLDKWQADNKIKEEQARLKYIEELKLKKEIMRQEAEAYELKARLNKSKKRAKESEEKNNFNLFELNL